MKELRERIAAALEPIGSLSFAILFGSQGRGDAGPHSDIDVAIAPGDGLPEDERGRIVRDVASAIADVVGDRRTDVVWADAAPPLLAHRIVRDGIPLVVRDPERLVRFKVRALSKYADTAPMRAFHFAALRRRLLEGGERGRRRELERALERARRLHREA